MTGPRIILFGKLPSHGDFVARGLDADARDAWDTWLSQGLAGARATLGDGFDTAYETAPPWRFVTGPGSFGPGWRAGALTPSVDSVGRRFPIVVATEDLSAEQAANEGAALAQAMDDAIRDAFEQQLTADAALQAAQVRAAEPQAAEPVATPSWWTEGGEHLASQATLLPPADLLVRLWTLETAERAA